MTQVVVSSSARFQYTSGPVYLQEETFCVASAPSVRFFKVELTHVFGFSTSAAVTYWQLFNGSGVTDVLVSVRVPANGSFSWAPPQGGWVQGFDVTWRVSTTGNIYTASLDTYWVNAQGIALCGP